MSLTSNDTIRKFEHVIPEYEYIPKLNDATTSCRLAQRLGWTKASDGKGSDWKACGGVANFNLEKLLGEGSSGQVCAATQISDGKQVAVKRVVGAFYSRRDALCIIREVRILAALPRHDNIVNLLDVRTPQENPSDDADVFLIFEKAATDLEKVVASNQYFTGDHIRWLLFDLLQGLRWLHSAGVVHRDLKPANCLLEVEPVSLKICDFGLARTLPRQHLQLSASLRAVDDDDYDDMDSSKVLHARPPLRRQMTTHVATRWYRAPEILLRTPTYDSSMDMWACGCVLAELLSMEKASVKCYSDRRSLFPGGASDQSPRTRDIEPGDDQLATIVRVVGCSALDVAALSSSAEVAQRLEAAKRAAPTGRRTFAALYPGADKDAIDLLENLTKMDPAQRYSADQCLDHAYMKPIRGMGDLLAPPDALDSVDPGPSLGLPQIRRLIRDHARGSTSWTPNSDEEGNDSDENWDIDEAKSRTQKASDMLFTATVREMILEGYNNGSDVESLIIEVNCYKLSENRSFRDAVPAALEAVVELAFVGREGKGQCAQGLVKAIAHWKPLLAKLLSSDAVADERFAVGALEELSSTRSPLNEPDVFALALQKLYEHDVLSEEGILEWGGSSTSPVRNSPQVGQLLAFLEDDNENESSDEESD